MSSDRSSPRLTVSTTREDGQQSISLVGEIDLHTVPVLEEALQAQPTDTVLVLDLTAVTFLDSVGLRAIVTAGERRSANGGSIRVTSASDAVRRVLEITGLAEHFGLAQA